MSTFESIPVDEVSANGTDRIRTSADWDDIYLCVVPHLSFYAWIASYWTLHYDDSHFVEHNTPEMWTYLCFSVSIVVITLIRLMWKVGVCNCTNSKYEYDATGCVRKVSFAIRGILVSGVTFILSMGEVDSVDDPDVLGTKEMVRIGNVLMIIDFIVWIIDCCIHYMVYGFPPIFRGCFCGRYGTDSNNKQRIYIPMQTQWRPRRTRV
eukprot:207906_1